METSGGRFRKKRTNFSMVSNNIIRDDTVSLKAKGLYALIQSYITIEDFTLYKGFLQSKCCEGKKAFDSAWKELKETGYLVQYRMQDQTTKQIFWEYELLDELPEKPHTQNGGMAPTSHIPQRDSMAHGIDGDRDDMAFGGTNNISKLNTDYKEYVSNHIISAEDVKRQIDYPYYQEYDLKTVESIIMIMLDVLNMDDSEMVRVNQKNLTAAIVKNRFKQINHSHIEYILLVLKDFTGKISNTRSFMITTIYNAPATMEVYFTNRVNHDMYGMG